MKFKKSPNGVRFPAHFQRSFARRKMSDATGIEAEPNFITSPTAAKRAVKSHRRGGLSHLRLNQFVFAFEDVELRTEHVP